MRAHGTTTFEGKSGYGLDHDTELAQLAAIAAAGGVPTWLGAHTVPPEHPDADAYVDLVIAEVLPDAARIATAADVFVERGTFDVEQARRYLEACRGPGSRCACTATSSPRSARSSSRSSSARARSTTSRRRARRASRRSRRATSSACCSRSARSSSGARCLPPARSSTRARRSRSRPTSTPGSAFCESLPVVCTLACTQLGLAPEEALAACTVNAAHVLGLADRGRLAPGYRADLVLLDAPDWRHLAYHLAGDIVHTVIRGGRVAFARA